MSAALTHHDPFDGSPAHRASFSFSSIDTELILEIAAAVNPVDAGSIASDPFLQCLPDCLEQDGGLLGAQLIGNA